MARDFDLIRQYQELTDKNGRMGQRLIAKLLYQYKGLVRLAVVERSQECPESFEDLEQVGTLGLLKAIERFDTSRNVAFSSFAMPYIRGSIAQHLRDRWGLLKIPRSLYELRIELNKLGDRYRSKGIDKTLNELAIELGIEGDRWLSIQHLIKQRPIYSLDQDYLPRGSQMPQGLDPYDSADYMLLMGRLAALDPEQRDCLRKRYLDELTLQEISEQEGLTMQQVRSRIQEGLKRLKGCLAA